MPPVDLKARIEQLPRWVTKDLDADGRPVEYASVKLSDVLAALVGEEPPADKSCNFIQAATCAERWPADQTQWCGRCLLRNLRARVGAEPSQTKTETTNG